MRILVLGGTIFLGRHMVDLALAAGDTVTLFTRGRHGPELFPGVERITGDRATDLSLLDGRTWDAVVDTSGYLPTVVRDSARCLAGRAGHYTFVSSISVYRDFKVAGVDEEYPCGVLPEGAGDAVTNETYGPLKALCEQAAVEEFAGRVLIIRPGLIVGPHDPSDRFTYWPERIARGGEVLAPDAPDRVTQVIDARDLASWMLASLRAGLTGTFNATSPGAALAPAPVATATAAAATPAPPWHPTAAGPPAAPGFPLTFGDLFGACRDAGGSDARLTWIPEAFLLEQEVGAWMELPLWVPREPDSVGFDAVSVTRAIEAGLALRPIGETVRDTLAWARTLPTDRPRRAGLDPAKETEVLRRWNAR
jgi:2'-hydroxyisoflavone reductase